MADTQVKNDGSFLIVSRTVDKITRFPGNPLVTGKFSLDRK